jgi:hypothetical protein
VEEIYERARREVTFQRADGAARSTPQSGSSELLRRVGRKTSFWKSSAGLLAAGRRGFGRLEDAGREDLMLETLVLEVKRS